MTGRSAFTRCIRWAKSAPASLPDDPSPAMLQLRTFRLDNAGFDAYRLPDWKRWFDGIRYLSARSDRLWPLDARSEMAGRCAHRGTVRHQLRRGRRELDPRW